MNSLQPSQHLVLINNLYISKTPTYLHIKYNLDLQFVFHLQDPDGRISRVGICNDGTCNDVNQRIIKNKKKHYHTLLSMLNDRKIVTTGEIKLQTNKFLCIRRFIRFIEIEFNQFSLGGSSRFIKMPLQWLGGIFLFSLVFFIFYVPFDNLLDVFLPFLCVVASHYDHHNWSIFFIFIKNRTM